MPPLKTLLTFVAITLAFSTAPAQAQPLEAYLLLPAPRQIEYTDNFTQAPAVQLEQESKIDYDAVASKQGYQIKITPDQISIVAHDQAGLYYARQTLNQIIKQSGNQPLRCLTINDYPDFPVRGVMLDISRDKVPTMETLYNLIDMLASWKINHFQLYTEHTFAYKNHKTVWQDASPMTAEEIQALDKYCKSRYIDLVPNQNSFGHMQRWLKHEEYLHLAEAPDYVKTVWGNRRQHTLYPAEPGSIELISELYDELLPNFSSKYLNVGCDETVELGNGRSKELCEKIGRNRVYLDYLLKIHEQVQKHGKIMMFWADMVQNHPEVLDELPKDIIPLLWGYSETHPFDKYCQAVAQTGCKFYVCPGNSTWITIAGQTDKAKANLLNAAQNGLKYGAGGYVITDWGDLGDWEPITVSYSGYAYGAALSWSVEKNQGIDLAGVLSKFAFDDQANIMGQLMYDLGNAYKVGDVIIHNSSWFGRLLQLSDWNIAQKAPGLTVEKIHELENYVDRVTASLNQAQIQRGDADTIVAETKQVVRLIHHACDLGVTLLNTENKTIAEIPLETRQKLALDMKEIMENQKALWLIRNRPGGLKDSVERMENKINAYEQDGNI